MSDGRVSIYLRGLKSGSTLTGLQFNSTYYDWEIGEMVIREYAFQDCTQLTAAPVFPTYLKEIGDGAFDGCSQMQGTLVVPEGCRTIGKAAFRQCVSLTGVRFPSVMDEIGSQAFRGCTGMTGALDLPSGLRILDSDTFSCTTDGNGNEMDDAPRFTSLTIPEGMEIIYGSVFSGCRFLSGSLTIPDSMKKISSRAFMNCGFNGSLHLGSGLTEIGSYAFRGCHFTGNLQIPGLVTKIGNQVFGSLADYSSVASEPVFTAGQFTGMDFWDTIQTVGLILSFIYLWLEFRQKPLMWVISAMCSMIYHQLRFLQNRCERFPDAAGFPDRIWSLCFFGVYRPERHAVYRQRCMDAYPVDRICLT